MDTRIADATRITAPRSAIALLLVDGVLGVLLGWQLATQPGMPTPSAVMFCAFLVLGGLGGIGLMWRKRYGVGSA